LGEFNNLFFQSQNFASLRLLISLLQILRQAVVLTKMRIQSFVSLLLSVLVFTGCPLCVCVCVFVLRWGGNVFHRNCDFSALKHFTFALSLHAPF
jgi:hypothetical protein